MPVKDYGLDATGKLQAVVLAGKSHLFLASLDFSSQLQAFMKTGWM